MKYNYTIQEKIEKIDNQLNNLSSEIRTLNDEKQKLVKQLNKSRREEKQSSDSNSKKRKLHELIIVDEKEEEKEIYWDGLLTEHINILIENVVEQIINEVIVSDLKEHLKQHIDVLHNILKKYN